MKKLQSIILDIKSIPAHFKDNRGYAEHKKNYICSDCPPERRALRKVNGSQDCWWYENWKEGNYDIPRTFGPLNYLTQYLFGQADPVRYLKKKMGDAFEL